MSRPGCNLQGVPDGGRYGNGPGRYDNTHGGREDSLAGSYTSLPTTLEEETLNGGWLHNEMPTSEAGRPIRLYTIGMRGEPGLDDDPVPQPGKGRYAQTPSTVDVDNSSYD